MKKDDIGRIRTCAGEPKGFLVPRLNHSATMSWSDVSSQMDAYQSVLIILHFLLSMTFLRYFGIGGFFDRKTLNENEVHKSVDISNSYNKLS